MSAPASLGLRLRRELGAYPTGVAAVTASGPQTQVGFTISSFSPVSLDPLLVLFSLAQSAPSLSVLLAASHYTVNVLGAGQRELAARFARPAPDKSDGLQWRRGAGRAPLLAGCAAYFQCASYATYPGGDHTIFLGEIVEFVANPPPPLAFHGGVFCSLEQVLSEQIQPWGVSAS